ncbi:intein N-terminal splicing domain protein, partial [Leptospira noguchii str. 2007001578]
MTGEGSYLAGLFGPNGLGPGMTITGINQADLRAFMNEDNDPHPNGGPNQYCPDPLGCHSGDIFHPDPGIYGANDTFSSRGYDFNRYIARELGVWAGIPFLADIEHYQDYAWIELSFTVTNNNAYANVTTYQDLVLQLQSFEHDWMTNVMPSVTNWTAQVASYNAQYANWQTQMQTAITDAQNAYNSGVQDIQNQESSWLAQMGQLQQQASNAFDAAANALKNGQGQGNYGQLTQQILAGLNKGQLQSNLSNSTDTMQYGDGFSNILNNLDRNADRGIPNFSLLSSFGSSMSRALTGVSNLTLLSSTNNALMDNILGYMQNVADSMRNERQFTQNGQQDLIEAHGLKTKVIKTHDKYSGEEISTSYVLDENGNIRMFKDEDGEMKQMTVGDWIQETCGKDLGKCGSYTENKYESVAIDSKGNITAHRSVYNGTTSQCGADFTQSSSYCYNEDDRVVTIAPPNPKALLLGRGASRLGDIFDGNDNGIGDLVNTTFQNVGTFLSSNKYTDGLFYDVKNAQMESDHNASIAANDVSNKVKIANLIVDYAEAVLYGGMSTSSWVTKQAHQAVQDVMATALVNTFDFSPEVASFLSGALITREVARHEKSSFAVQNLGINHAINEMAEALNRSDLKFLSVGDVLESINIGPNAEKLRAVQDWKDFKYQTYAFGIQQIGKANGLPPETSAAISQAVVSHLRMQSVKEELGMRSGMYSLNAAGGAIRGVLNGVESLVGEIVGGVVLKGLAHVSKEAGLTSHSYEHTYDKGVQQRIDILKHREGKEIIRQAAANDVAAYGAIVKAVGDDLHLDPAVTENWVKMTTEFVSRKQAEGELHHRNGFLGGKGAFPVVTWVDNTIFNGAITTLLAKAVKGITTTVGDIGHFISPKSDTFRHSMYQQGNNFYNDMTSTDVKARAQQGIINKAYLETQMRDKLFDAIGEAFFTGDKEAAHNLGLLLKHHIDQKEAKKAAREQRLKDTQMIVQVAAAAAATYFGGPAGIQMLNSIIGTSATAINTTLATVGLSLNNAQVAALAVSTAVSIGVESSINGTNGAAAALINGLISTATMGVKTPVTGYVSYTKHQNANLLTGQHEVKGGWGGGLSANIAGAKSLPLGEAIKAFAAAMKMSNLSLGLSYNADAGLGMNVNTNFTSGLGLGLDYNFKSKDYTANASYDLNNIGGKKWANVNLGISASKSGHASFSASYNSDGNTHIPQSLRGGGATLDFGNDGLIGLSVQGLKGATIGTLTYDTNTHGFQPLSLNYNFQNEFNQGQAAENAANNHQKSQMEILMKELSLGTKMDKPLFTQAEIDKALPKDEHGNIDMDKADPEKLLEKWNAHKEAMSQTPDGLKKWKDEVSRAGERSGIEVKFNDGKSATSTFGKFVKGLMGDVAQSFGFANDGSKMVDKAGVFHLDTCFAGDTSVRTETGLKAIESIVVGDVVKSWNENTNLFENKRVTQVFVHEVPQLFFLELDGEEEIHVTWNHPFRRRTPSESGEVSTANAVSSSELLGVSAYELLGVSLLDVSVSSGDSSDTNNNLLVLGEKDQENSVLQTLTTNQLATNISKAQTLTPPLTTRSEWVKVEDLRLRDQVLRSDGSWGTVTGIYYYNTEPTKVYNLEVEDNHTYIVGGDTLGIGYVVHNYQGEFDKGVAAIKAQVKGFMGGSGLFGLGAEHPMSGEAKALHDNLTHYDGEDKRLGGEKNQIATEGRRLEGQKELFFRKNDFLLGIVRDSSSNGVEGIADLRKSLANADPKRGFSKAEMSAIGDFMKKNFGNSNGLGMNFGGSGFTTGGMSNLIANGGIKSELFKAAGEAGSSGTLAHLNERLGANKEQLRLKTIEHEAAGANLARVITQDFEKFKVAASERHYNDANYSDFIARNQKSGIKLESPTTYMTNEGKKVQAEHQSKLEFIKRYGELDTHGSNGKVVAEQLLNSRERYIQADMKREETANRLLNESPAYKEKRGIIERSGQEASRLQTELESRRTQLHLEGKTDRQIASDADVKRLQSDFEKHTKLKETTKSEIETLYKNTLTKLDSKSVYGPEIYTAAIKTAERNPEYSENLKKITQMRDSKEMSTGGLFDKLAPGLNLNRDTNEKIAFLEKRNSEIVDGYAKQELKLHDKESN